MPARPRARRHRVRRSNGREGEACRRRRSRRSSTGRARPAASRTSRPRASSPSAAAAARREARPALPSMTGPAFSMRASSRSPAPGAPERVTRPESRISRSTISTVVVSPSRTSTVRVVGSAPTPVRDVQRDLAGEQVVERERPVGRRHGGDEGGRRHHDSRPAAAERRSPRAPARPLPSRFRTEPSIRPPRGSTSADVRDRLRRVDLDRDAVGGRVARVVGRRSRHGPARGPSARRRRPRPS